MIDTKAPKPKSRLWNRAFILAALPILIVTILAVLTLPFLPSGGWSEDVELNSGSMNMRVQFKTDPASPTAGPVALMARIKSEGGFTSRVNQLVFNYSIASQQFAQGMEGVPVGEFGMQGEGFYTAAAELPFAGDWQLKANKPRLKQLVGWDWINQALAQLPNAKSGCL